MKALKVNPSEYEWSIVPYPGKDNHYILNVIDSTDGERMFTVDNVGTPVLSEAHKKVMLNIFLAGFYKGSRAGADKFKSELRRIIGIEG